jgi:hypothetical protein
MSSIAISVHFWDGNIQSFIMSILLEENGKGCVDF